MLPVRIIRRKSSLLDAENSFLQEVNHNPDISKEVRDVVEFRFRMSKVNSTYVFPRKKVSRLDEFLKAKRSKSQTVDFHRRKLNSTQSSSILNVPSNKTVKMGVNKRQIPPPNHISLKFLDKFNVGYNPKLRMIHSKQNFLDSNK